MERADPKKMAQNLIRFLSSARMIYIEMKDYENSSKMDILIVGAKIRYAKLISAPKKRNPFRERLLGSFVKIR